jgi:hypothetical protein
MVDLAVRDLVDAPRVDDLCLDELCLPPLDRSSGEPVLGFASERVCVCFWS